MGALHYNCCQDLQNFSLSGCSEARVRGEGPSQQTGSLCPSFHSLSFTKTKFGYIQFVN